MNHIEAAPGSGVAQGTGGEAATTVPHDDAGHSAGGEAAAAPPPPHDAPSADADERMAAWNALTPVERTSLGVAYWRAKAVADLHHPATGAPLYHDPYSQAVVDKCIPSSVAAEMGAKDRVMMVGLRTAEVDRQVLGAARAALAATAAPEAGGGAPEAAAGLKNGRAGLQVVIIGAGLDARAWRLQWPAPPGGRRLAIFEADTPAILGLKRRALSPSAAAGERREVPCDLRDTDGFTQGLVNAGFDASVPTVWLLEGLIGYLTRPQALALLRTLRALSVPGSRAVITAPPTEQERDRSAARGQPLHHSTFEPAEATLARACEAGWQGRLVTWEELKQRYGLDGGQQVLVLEAAVEPPAAASAASGGGSAQ